MKSLLLIFSLSLVLCSCTTFGDLTRNLADTKEVISDLGNRHDELEDVIGGVTGNLSDLYEQGEELVDELGKTGDELKQMEGDAFKEADKDGDGDLDWLERLSYLILLGGGSLEIGRRKLKSIQGGIAHERTKRKQLEANVHESKPG